MKRFAKRNVIVSAILALSMCLPFAAGCSFGTTSDLNLCQVTAGGLNVTLEAKNAKGEWKSAENTVLAFSAASGSTLSWTAGSKHVLPTLRVKNSDENAVKVTVDIKINGDEKLNEVIDWTINDEVISDDYLVVYSGETSEELTVKAAVKATAGKEYNDLSLDSAAITVTAVKFPASGDELRTALTHGGNITITSDVETANIDDTADARISITTPTTLNLKAKIISPDNMGNNNSNFAALYVDADTVINADENGGIDTGTNGGYGINVRKGAKLTINGGYYYGGGTAVQVQEGTLTINGGTFAVEPFGEPYGYDFLFNCVDAAYKAGTAKIIVKGGTFINFNPADNKAEGAGTNFVADGYMVKSTVKENGDVWYTVVGAPDANNITDEQELNYVLAKGGDVTLANNIDVVPVVEDMTVSTLVPQMTVTSDVNLDLSGKKIATAASAAEADYGNASPLLIAVTGGTLTIDGDGEINCETGNNQVYGINVNGGSVVVNSGKFYGALTAIQVQKGSLVINGGFFDMAPTCKNVVPQYAKYIVNCIDAAYKNGTATISITGGTFVNFDPSANPEGANTSYVAKGYTVTSETKGEDVWYTVVKDVKQATTQEGLNEVINSAADGATIALNEGTFTLPSLENKEITITGTKDTVIDMSGAINKAVAASFDGVTVKFANESYKGFQHTGKLVYKDCTIVGLQFLYADEVEFINCEFTQTNDDAYHVWTYGAKNVTFTKCVFKSTSASKAVLCYTEGGGQTFTRTFNECVFEATGTAEKSAIMINPTANAGETNTYVININKCTATGYTENGIEGQTIVGVKQTVKDTITVNIDGQTVYTH
ncbi:MAG: hypothetical protein SOX77_03040 [Candidatus Borkfalkiaceae bacterium]|nr:hypothetical protein [Christensenellaceae bacterium]